MMQKKLKEMINLKVLNSAWKRSKLMHVCAKIDDEGHNHSSTRAYPST
jgi:hypothetical protein